jgi:uncharacterized protein YbjT (DUF2867 family)
MDLSHGTLVTVFGGSGFIGTQVVQALARRGLRIRVAVRRPDLAGHVRPLGNVGQIQPIQANVRNEESVMRAVQGADIVINLVGIGSQAGRQTFQAVHLSGARAVAEAARRAGVRTLVHMSVLGADLESPSTVARSRAEGELEARDAFAEAIIIRPSVVFGQGDGFFNRFGSLARILPVLPVIGGDSLMQPVYVGDVAEAVARAATGTVAGGRVYELGGPEIATVKELMQRVLHESERTNPLIPVPAALARLLALALELLPSPIITRDQVIQLNLDNVVSEAAIEEGRTLAAFGIVPTSLGAVLPTFMWRFRKNGQFDRQPA